MSRTTRRNNECRDGKASSPVSDYVRTDGNKVKPSGWSDMSDFYSPEAKKEVKRITAHKVRQVAKRSLENNAGEILNNNL